MIDRPMMITLEEHGLLCRRRDSAGAHPCPRCTHHHSHCIQTAPLVLHEEEIMAMA